MMTPRLRAAQAADVGQLAHLARDTYSAAFGHTYEAATDLAAHLQTGLSDTRVAQWLAQDAVTLADLEGRIVGFAHFGPIAAGSYGGFPDAGDSALHRLYVARDLLNVGVGAALLRAALADMGRAGKDIYLDVWEGNHGAQRLYARHGFVPLGRVTLTTASGLGAGDDIVMVRRRPAVQAGSRV
ncbi:GNAT family N-acetyltransferase [Phenylobacterium sp.]|uniref:GNAT family N-acetyltransferase n=1 Tax=Phenylobacterium sp. TaxID=1871053 RepID=UPI00286B6184|nr:GNAT family N-acetyltransferase [Phenylobacterium sp.]